MRELALRITSLLDFLAVNVI
ncbi:hypothetical protein [Escherichia coli]